MLLRFCDILPACVHQILSQVTFSLMENKCTFVTYIKFFLVTYRLVSKGATLRCPDRETHLLSFISIGSSSLRMVSSVNCVVNIEGFPLFKRNLSTNSALAYFRYSSISWAIFHQRYFKRALKLHCSGPARWQGVENKVSLLQARLEEAYNHVVTQWWDH